MHFSALVVLAIALVAKSAPTEAATEVAQDNCKHGLYYCGAGLLHKGNYFSDMFNALTSAHQPTDENHFNYSIFFCAGDDDVPFQRYCGEGKCVDGGSGRSDHCA